MYFAEEILNEWIKYPQSAADKKTIAIQYIENALERNNPKERNGRWQVKHDKNFADSLAMAIYTLDKIKDTHKIILVSAPNFIYQQKNYSAGNYQASWSGNIKGLDNLSPYQENIILKPMILNIINQILDKFNSHAEDINHIFIYDLFGVRSIQSELITSALINSDTAEIRFLSRFLIQNKINDGINLLESIGL